MTTGKQHEGMKVMLGQRRHPRTANSTEPLMNPDKVPAFGVSGELKMIVIHKQPSLEMRFASSVTAEAVESWRWSVNEVDTLSLFIKLIHLIKVVCLSLHPGQVLQTSA